MPARLRLIIDGGDTVSVPNFALPSAATATKRCMVAHAKESEYVEAVLDDGATGDTLSWGLRNLVIVGVSQKRDIDL